jgi:hypothetical protein
MVGVRLKVRVSVRVGQDRLRFRYSPCKKKNTLGLELGVRMRVRVTYNSDDQIRNQK